MMFESAEMRATKSTATETRKAAVASPLTRWQQAQQTVYIQYIGHVRECLDHVQNFGDIHVAYPGSDPEKGQLLVQMKTQSAVDALLRSCRHFGGEDNIPVASRHLYYRGNGARSTTRAATGVDARLSRHRAPGDGFDFIPQNAPISKQMQTLHQALILSEYGTRMRYFIASSLEEFMQKILPTSQLQLFGSTVNGFGRFDCDLDMSIDFQHETSKNKNLVGPDSGNMLFLTKTQVEDQRQHTRTMLELVGAAMRSAMPQCVQVQKVLRARVPIVKFLHGASGVECDVCIRNDSAVAMSRLLRSISEVDSRIAPLLFTIRSWARANQITHPHPGPWLSNFMLSLMAVYYLQSLPQPILSPLSEMVKISEGASGETIYRVLDTEKVAHTAANNSSLEELLKGFLKFYQDFDWKERGISVLNAGTVPKTDDLPLLLENPLENDMNCSQNVMEKHLLDFQEACRSSLAVLDGSDDAGQNGRRKGLLSILNHTVDSLENQEKSIGVQLDHIFDSSRDRDSSVQAKENVEENER